MNINPNWKEKNIGLLIYQQVFDIYKSLIIGGSIWLLLFNSLGNLTNQFQEEKDSIYQQWQQQKMGDRLDGRNRTKNKRLIADKYRETIELMTEIEMAEETAKKTIDITYSNQKQQSAKMVERSIALTFDDGPSPHTNKILNILKKYRAKATFFVTGVQVKYGCNTLKRIYNEGHEIANHTYDHSYLPGKSISYQKWQIETTQKAIQKCLGINYTSRWFRAPYGAQDSNTIKVVRSLGLNTALWTIDTNDWRSTTTTNSIINIVVKSKGQDVVLMHDIHQKTANSLESILINLNQSNMIFMNLSDAFGIQENPIAHISRKMFILTHHQKLED